MATVKAFIRISNKKVQKANVRFRLSDGRTTQLFHKSELEIEPSAWDAGKQRIKDKVIFDSIKRKEFDQAVSERAFLIKDIYNKADNKSNLSSAWLDAQIYERLNPTKISLPKTLFDIYDDFIAEYQGTNRMKQHYTAVKRMLQRFELYMQIKDKAFVLTFETVTPDVLKRFQAFLKEEHNFFEKFSDIYEAVPESRPPKPRSDNRINKILQYIRTVTRWAISNNHTSYNPFAQFKLSENVYGTPYYITIKERNDLYNYDFSGNLNLEIQRDIFVLQCLIGCRIGDLNKLTKRSVINGAIEYIQRKTKEGRPITVRVPLSTTAMEIINKYAQLPGEKLLPFTYEQNYRKAIKQIFSIVGLTRLVTLLDPLTKEEVKKPLNEIASSHIARRTFIGNLYKKVKDPNLVGALSGHKEGSKAFARYRDIDDEIKNDLIKMLE